MKVSVLIVTYNHEKYVERAIQSALDQKTNFDYEIVVGEDSSPDKTREIIASLQNQHPDKIRLLPPTDRLGMNRNYIRTLQECDGEYVAMLDGDDYWTCDTKLQKQVDFLDSHPECVMCIHRVTEISEPEGEELWVKPELSYEEITTIKDLLFVNYIPNCSALFRNGITIDMPEGYDELGIPDWPMHILNAQHGHIGYIKETMAVHTRHSAGMWSKLDNTHMLREDIKCYDYVRPYLDTKYHEYLRRGASYYHWLLVKEYAVREDWDNVRKHATEGLHENPCNWSMRKTLLVIGAKKRVPKLYELARKVKRMLANSNGSSNNTK